VISWGGLARRAYESAAYWDIVKRDNPCKGAETLGRAPRRRETAAGMRQDGAPHPHGVSKAKRPGPSAGKAQVWPLRRVDPEPAMAKRML